MKGNNGDGNTKDRDIWETPQILFNKLNKQYDFTFDCCAEEENSKCETFSSDFLDLEELGNVTSWMNPPFSKAAHMFDKFFNIVRRGVAIYRCDNMEWSTWQQIIFKNASWVFIPKGRVHYEGVSGNGCRFPSALIGFNVEPPKDLKGTTLFLNSQQIKNEDVINGGEPDTNASRTSLQSAGTLCSSNLDKEIPYYKESKSYLNNPTEANPKSI